MPVLLAVASSCSLQHAVYQDGGPPPPNRDGGRADRPPPADGSTECTADQMLCSGVCTSVADDPNNCGACGHDCDALPNVTGTTSCASGACVIAGACAPRYGDCDGNASNGCETDLAQPSNCGHCGVSCAGGAPVCAAATTPTGEEYMCVSGCPAGTTLCSGSCADVNTDGANCGACGNMCPAPADSRATCTAGRCSFECNASFHPCGARCAPDSSITACGFMCVACVAANGTPACVGGACTVAMCNPGFGDCDSVALNGCETATNTPANCGACGNACSAPAGGTAVCTGGLCDYTCPPPMVRTASGCGSATGTTCGNRVLDAGEQCDDGNNVAGDGCNASCQLDWPAVNGCPPGGQVFRVAPGGAQVYTGSTSGAAPTFACPSGLGTRAGDRAYNVAVTADGTLRIELSPGGGYDAVLIVRASCAAGATTLFCQDNRFDATATEVVNMPVTAGDTFTVVADGYNGSTGNYRLRFTLM